MGFLHQNGQTERQMRYPSLKDFIQTDRLNATRGPVAVVLAEDAVEVDSTLAHHLSLGFAQVILLAPPAIAVDDTLAGQIDRIDHDTVAPDALPIAVNALIAAAPGRWFYYCYNAEYLFFPFCEYRTVGEMIAFHAEERRDAILSYVVDLYARDLDDAPRGVSLTDAMLDRSGYYALARPDQNGHPRERQLNFFGGLRWRFEEHVPEPRRRIDRISVFKSKQGLEMTPDYLFNEQEYNTYSCPWHHNITVAIASFRTAKALKSNAGSTFDIPTFTWHNSIPFEWQSDQLLQLGLMEPGQWF